MAVPVLLGFDSSRARDAATRMDDQCAVGKEAEAELALAVDAAEL